VVGIATTGLVAGTTSAIVGFVVDEDEQPEKAIKLQIKTVSTGRRVMD
jgi:hypothetical protein